MVACKTKYILAVTVFLFTLFLRHNVDVDCVLAQSMLPGNVDVHGFFQAGPGLPVGKMQSVGGEVAVFHAGQTDGYFAKTGLPLFNGDTIVTRANGSFGCKLNDGSIIRLAPNSTLSLNHIAHDVLRKSSISAFSLIPGSAYFRIGKLDEFETREFKVETNTVIASGRQADFILQVTEATNEIVVTSGALEEVIRIADPQEKIFLSEFQRAVIEAGLLPDALEIISKAEAWQRIRKFQRFSAIDLSDVVVDNFEGKDIDRDEPENTVESDAFFPGL